ncbi:NCS1 nucleoside transporter family protein [Laetiporus sulphureus 93-53]|uniref:NCS1 nucleoside transporter family protein n=1 Tax=Laetiporus sulphureus 93-53 TaxID=1314785 RepID=A0A165CYL3_9APHY|nr:NCS1 nucleoside transporter family protein [Laetiporus sulphureus 93-53]KZT03757.1 NCS1 nucleoside transporter family protein [Laetiporus sulphureus 93-53]
MSIRRRLLKKLEVPNQGERAADRWHNHDLMPVEPARRTWGPRQFIELWILVNMNISGYQTGSSLVADGLKWWQAIICIIFGNLLSSMFCTLNSTSGAYYHIGYPAISRIAWGMNGSYFALVNRILLSVVWFAVQAWNGGLCVLVCLRAIWPHHIDAIPNPFPSSVGMTGAEFMCYILFNLLCVPLTYVHPHKLQLFFKFCAVVVLVNQIVMLIWSLSTMKGGLAGSALTTDVAMDTATLAWTMVYGIMAQIGGIAAGILNDNDFTRFAKTPERRAIAAQAISFPVTAFCTALCGIFITAATTERYGEALWNPPDLLLAAQKAGSSGARASTFFCAFAWIITQMGINVPGNLLAGGVDVAALWPKYINLRRGAYLILLVSIAVNPWQLLSSSSIFLEVLSAYSVFLSPMTGLMVSQYYVIQRRYFKISDVYIGDSRSIYWYTWGINWRAFVAFFSGVAPCITGFIGAVSPHTVSKTAARLYDLNYVLGFCIAFLMNCLLHRVFPVPRQVAFIESMEKAGAPKHLDGLESFIRDVESLDESVEREIVTEEKKRSSESLT